MKTLTQHIHEKLHIGKDYKPKDFESLIENHKWEYRSNCSIQCSDENAFDDIAEYIYAEGTKLDSDYVEESLNRGKCVCCMNRGQEEIQIIHRFNRAIDLYDVLFFYVVGEVNKEQVVLQNSVDVERRFVRCLNSTSDILANVNGKTPEWYEFPKVEFANIRNWYESI